MGTLYQYYHHSKIENSKGNKFKQKLVWAESDSGEFRFTEVVIESDSGVIKLLLEEKAKLSNETKKPEIKLAKKKKLGTSDMQKHLSQNCQTHK